MFSKGFFHRCVKVSARVSLHKLIRVDTSCICIKPHFQGACVPCVQVMEIYCFIISVPHIQPLRWPSAVSVCLVSGRSWVRSSAATDQSLYKTGGSGFPPHTLGAQDYRNSTTTAPSPLSG